MNNRFINYAQLITLLMPILFLASCVTDPGKKAEQGEYQELRIYNLDSDVEDMFDEAVGYLKSEKYDEAIKVLEQLIELENRVPTPYINLAMAYEIKGDKEKAEKYLLQAVKVDLAHPVANNQLGMLYRKLGRFDDAKKAYMNALTRNPDYLPVIKNLGILCEIYMRDLPCALEQYERYLELQPDDKTMSIWVSDLVRRAGK